MSDLTAQEKAEIALGIAIANSSTGNDFAEEEKKGIRDPISGRFKTHQDNGGDLGLNVRFFVKAEQDKAATYHAGGVPKYRDVEYIVIEIPAQPELRIETYVDERHKFRFPTEYQNFKNGLTARITGTPLALWAALQPSQVAEMENAGIRTVEQLANLSENGKGAVSGFYGLKARAAQFLEEASDKAAAGAVRAEMEARDERHKAELKAQEDRFTAMLESRLAALEKPKKAKPSEAAGE